MPPVVAHQKRNRQREGETVGKEVREDRKKVETRVTRDSVLEMRTLLNYPSMQERPPQTGFPGMGELWGPPCCLTP